MTTRIGPQSQLRQRLRGAAVLTAIVVLVGILGTAPAEATPAAESAGSRQSPGETKDDGRLDLTWEEFKAVLSAEAAKPRFDGSLRGWRVAQYHVLEGAGISDRNLSRSCEPYEAGAETRTQLDFTVTYLPPEFKIGPVEGPIKWLCGEEGLSVLSIFNVDTPLGGGQIWVARSIQGRRTLEMDVPDDSVEAATINGTPAIVVHPTDDASGLGMGRVVLIEDDVDPEFTILSVTTDNVPFDELIKIVEGIR